MSTYAAALEEFCSKTKMTRLRRYKYGGWEAPYIAPFPPIIWESFEARGIGFCWSYVLGGLLKISTLAKMRLVCKEWNDVIGRTDHIWRDVFLRTLRGFEVYSDCGPELDEDAPILSKEGIQWVTLVKEAITTPFVAYQDGVYEPNSIGLNQRVYEAMQQYRNSRGVINWTFLRPHKLWAKLYKKILPTYLHKIGVILAVDGRKFEIGTDLTRLLWDNDWERQSKDKLRYWGNVTISSMNRMEPALRGDLIKQCANPPYGIRFTVPSDRPAVESCIRDHLYRTDIKDNPGIDWITNWKGMLVWAPLWKSGQDWWGCYCQSHYVQEDKLLVVSTASTSD